MKRLIKWIGIALFACVVLAVIAAVLGGGGKDSDTAATPSAPQALAPDQEQQPSKQADAKQPTQAPAPTNAPELTSIPEPINTPEPQPSPTPVPAIGTDVSVGKINWKVTTASALGQTLKSDNQFIEDKTTSGKFVTVSYQVENRDTDKVYFEAPKLVDAQERKFSDYNEALSFVPEKERCIFKELNPNVPATCTVIYEVAADAKQLMAEVTSLALFGGSPILIDLAIEDQ